MEKERFLSIIEQRQKNRKPLEVKLGYSSRRFVRALQIVDKLIEGTDELDIKMMYYYHTKPNTSNVTRVVTYCGFSDALSENIMKHICQDTLEELVDCGLDSVGDDSVGIFTET